MTFSRSPDCPSGRAWVFSRSRQFCCCSPYCCFSRPTESSAREWAQFIGRFHLLTVHFPIALILLVPVLELTGRNRRFPDLARCGRFHIGAGNLQCHRGRNARMVPGTKRWLFRLAGHPAHVGWSRPSRPSAGSVGCCAGDSPASAWDFIYALGLVVAVGLVSVDRVSRRPVVPGRKSPHRTHAGGTALLAGAIGSRRQTFHVVDRAGFLFMASASNRFSPDIAYLPRPGQTQSKFAAALTL